MLKTALEQQDDTILKEIIGPDDDLILHPLVLHLRASRHPWMVEGEHQYLLAYETCVQILKEHLETKWFYKLNFNFRVNISYFYFEVPNLFILEIVIV